jgi:hypothetical protein
MRRAAPRHFGNRCEAEVRRRHLRIVAYELATDNSPA